MLLMLRLGALAGNEPRSQKRVVADCLARDMPTRAFFKPVERRRSQHLKSGWQQIV